MSAITTHVLDIANGKPASGVPVTLEYKNDGKWESMANGNTNDDGRVSDLLDESHDLKAGTYRLNFSVKTYFDKLNAKTFYPEASITFLVESTSEHYHVPLLLSNFGYSTYRGS